MLSTDKASVLILYSVWGEAFKERYAFGVSQQESNKNGMLSTK